MWFRGSRRPVLVRDEPRVAVAATVETPQGVVTVVNTHLTFLTWWNGRQLHNLVTAVQHATRPLLLMGDLNLGPARAQALTRMRPLATHRTFPRNRPRAQIDHILVDGDLKAGHSEARQLPLSDHRALVADVG
jgi:endonuclease/exonuclease/phosphatase family metal-dependent hydrolase